MQSMDHALGDEGCSSIVDGENPSRVAKEYSNDLDTGLFGSSRKVHNTHVEAFLHDVSLPFQS